MMAASAPAGPGADRPLRVVYVMGSGHVGSSVLGAALGNCEGFFYVGELDEWLLNEGSSRWGGDERTRFWEKVRERVGEIPPQLRGGGPNRCIERSSAALRIYRWPARRRMRPVYRRLAGDLLRAIAGVSREEVLVDSSHWPLRARELERLAGIELYLVFLVRDPRSVVASYIRAISPHEVAERRARVIATNAGLWLTQLLSILVFLRHPRARRVFLRHEQLLADPEGVMRELLDHLGSRVPVPDLDALHPGVTLEGSRLLRGGTIAMHRSRSRPRRWSLLTLLVQGPFEPILSRLRPALRTCSPARSR
jgi:Sulfotransferase family